MLKLINLIHILHISSIVTMSSFVNISFCQDTLLSEISVAHPEVHLIEKTLQVKTETIKDTTKWCSGKCKNVPFIQMHRAQRFNGPLKGAF